MAVYDFSGPGLNLGSGDRPEQVKGIHVSQEYFRVFGVTPVEGRTFLPREDQPGGPKAALVSDSLWQTRLGGDPSLVGKPIILGGDPYTVVGILPSSFRPDPPADVFIPLQADPEQRQSGPLSFDCRPSQTRRYDPGSQRQHESGRGSISRRQSEMDGTGRKRRSGAAARRAGRRRAAAVADSSGRGELCTVDRMCQCREPAAGARSGRVDRGRLRSAPPSAPAADVWFANFSPRA